MKQYDEYAMLGVRQRIMQVLELYQVSLSSFASKTPLTYHQVYAMVKQSQPVSSVLITTLLQHFEEVSPHWLNIGAGPMLKNYTTMSTIKEFERALEQQSSQMSAVQRELMVLLTDINEKLLQEREQLLEALQQQAAQLQQLSIQAKKASQAD